MVGNRLQKTHKINRLNDDLFGIDKIMNKDSEKNMIDEIDSMKHIQQ